MIPQRLKRFKSVPGQRAPLVPPGSRVYAVGDVHGRLDLLNSLLGKIERDIIGRAKAKNYLVMLGDLIDRGPDSCGVIERLMTYRQNGVQPYAILGNHEEVLLRIVAGEAALLGDWLRFGGRETLESYGLQPDELMDLNVADIPHRIKRAIPASHLRFLESFVDSLKIGDYLFVHAGIRPKVELSLQTQSDLRWIRAPFLDYQGDHGFVVVHGHTISDEIVQRHNRIGIDTGAYSTGLLSAVAFEGTERWHLEAVAQIMFLH